jgi:restriction endonuclease S subunit
VVKTGEKDSEKRFLGYEFSNRRGSEGIHPIQRGKPIEECTRLFDGGVFDNPEKASTYIYKAFVGDYEYPVHDSLKDNVSRIRLVDMLTFSRRNFEKNISTAAKKEVKIESKWEIVKLETVARIDYGTRIVKATESGTIYPVYGGGGKTFNANSFNRENSFIISRFGMSLECVRFVSGKFFLNDSGMTVNSLNKRILNSNYLNYYLFLNQEKVYLCGRGVSQKNIDIKKFSILPIPLPPVEIQQKIVSEIEIFEKKEDDAKKTVENLLNKINNILGTLKYDPVELENIVSLKNGLNYNRKSLGDTVNIVGVGDFQNNIVPNLDSIEQIQIEGRLSADYILKPNDLLVVRSNGSANLVGRFLLIDKAPSNTSFSGFTIRIRPDLEKVNSKYLCYYLRTEKVREKLTKTSGGSNIKSLNQTSLLSLTVPLPPLPEQQKIVVEIEKIEMRIAEARTEIDTMIERKKAILQKYL